MSAVDRMCTLFFLPHVVGHGALDFPEDVRVPLLTAISLAQVFVIATRGARSYNEREWREIFDRGWIVFFGALSRLHQISFQHSYSKRLAKHRRNPTKYAAPKEFKKTSRYVSIYYWLVRQTLIGSRDNTLSSHESKTISLMRRLSFDS